MESSAAEQLAAIADARTKLADRIVTPWWYHPILGLLTAGAVVAISIGNAVVNLTATMLFVAATVLLANAYRQRTGIDVSGFSVVNRWAIATGALIGVILITAWATATYTDLRWPVLPLAVTGFIGTIGFGRRADHALRTNLRATT